MKYFSILLVLLLISTFTTGSPLLEYERNTIDVYKKASPSVVFITSKKVQYDFFSMNAYETPQGTGSGFIWDKQGHIVTNFHVIQSANNIYVKLSNDKSYEAKVVGVEPNKDLAVLKIKAPASLLIPVEQGSSKDLVVGRKVLAIGNPFGLDQTLTIGIISALGRQINSVTDRKIHDVIQTDAAINPGNSGGPLLDAQAKLIGVNTAIITPSGGSAGIGFAVPVNTVKRVVPQLIKYGKVIRPGLGVQTLNDNIAQQNRITGVAIVRVLPRSSAAKAGLQGIKRSYYGDVILGDIITEVNGNAITNNDELSFQLEKHSIGDTITLTVSRDKKNVKIKIQLQQIQ